MGPAYFTLQGSTRLKTAIVCKVLQMRFWSWPKRLIKTRSPKTGRATSHCKEVNYIFDRPDSYESKRKQKLTAWEVMAAVSSLMEGVPLTSYS
jgi:hypothetical protein